MNKIYKFRFLILVAIIVIAFLIGVQLGWNWGHEDGVKESKAAIGKSMELYNLGEVKYILLARETAEDEEANQEFAQKIWDIKTRQDELLKDVLEFAKKLGIDTNTKQVPLAE